MRNAYDCCDSEPIIGRIIYGEKFPFGAVSEEICTCCDGEPVVGRIIYGEKYPFGTVSEETYEADMEVIKGTVTAASVEINNLKSTVEVVSDKQNSDKTELQRNINNVLSVVTSTEEMVTTLSNDYKRYKLDNNDVIDELNKKIDKIMRYEPVDIVKFDATPNTCEIGETENIILSWEVSGSVENTYVNNKLVDGNSIAIPAVTHNTEYRLEVISVSGASASLTASVRFVNHIYWGVTNEDTITRSIVKDLSETEMTDDIFREITFSLNNEYVVYAYPKRLGFVNFEVNGVGGFENPIIIKIDNHAGYQEDYYVYRSTRKLRGRVKISIKKG